MKNLKKTLALVLVVILAMSIGVAGTLAYLTDSETVTNTFTIGNVDITLTEYLANDVEATTNALKNFKVVPGGTATKKPVITVVKDSESCWLYACIENNVQVAVNGTQTTVATVNVGTDWVQVKSEGNKTLYRYTSTAVASSTSDQTYTVFDTVTYANTITETNRTDITDDDTIVVSAFAHQADSVDMTTADSAAIAQFFPTT